jgi:hypothetical protein
MKKMGKMEKMEKIDVAKILAKCPRGMELDCAVFENLYLDYVDVSSDCPYPIICYYKKDNGVQNVERFSKYGTYLDIPNAKCVIYPKGESSWEGFEPPFKDGDIVTCGWDSDSNSFSWTCIVAEPPCKITDNYLINDYCSLDCSGDFVSGNSEADSATYVRFATEEERQMLFKAIEDNGYKWDAEKKRLEKLFKPKFKVGDRIQYNGSPNYKPIYIIKSLRADRYMIDDNSYIKFKDEDFYSLLK